MSTRYDSDWVAGLLDTERRLGSIDPEGLLSASGLRQGMTVVDYGCGPGFFTLPAAEIVGPEGLVYAVDVEPRMVSLVAARAAESAPDNVRALLNETGAAPLGEAVADFAICALVMHYYDDHDGRVGLARDLGRLAAPASRVLLVQRQPDGPRGPSHGISFEETSAIMAEGGFECDGPRQLVEGQYTAIATKQS